MGRHRDTAARVAAAALAALTALTACGDDGGEKLPPCTVCDLPAPAVDVARDWLQWGRGPAHAGAAAVVAQPLARIVDQVVVDGAVEDEKALASGNLLVHYQAPLPIGGTDVLMAFKRGSLKACPPTGGSANSCGSGTWDQLTWGERLYRLQDGRLRVVWEHASDWKPLPDLGGLSGWQPVFHAVVAPDGTVVVPAAHGAIVRLDRSTGAELARVAPFGDAADTFVTGPPTVDDAGRVYYHALTVDPADPWAQDARGAWLVRVDPDGEVTKVDLTTLIPDAPAGDGACKSQFRTPDLPWPPSPEAEPTTLACGSQRAGVNVAPAIAADGAVVTVTRAHRTGRYGYVVALEPDLTLRWATSLRGLLHDGCGSRLMPPTGTPGGCRAGAVPGVDPATNELPAAVVSDQSSASPVVTPDGGVLYGAYTRYNGARGHLVALDAGGALRATYDFGWDTTPAVWEHDGTYSVIVKENAYGAGSYCSDDALCPKSAEGPYQVTQLTPDLDVEWQFTMSNTLACRRDKKGAMVCDGARHPESFELCVNAPAVDADGTVLVNAEDGRLYAIAQGGTVRDSVFLDEALGAAYTPVALGRDGVVFAQNNGRMFVVGP
ncbi:MAG: PQQ-like beta-propeller repeat protein [Myxococcales bacterium]|nr:PQQ-like beta-propeller repeat protein [Myxococcales bacterium]